MPIDFMGPRRPADILGEYMDPTGALQLSQLRSDRQSELEDRVAMNPQDRAAATMLAFLQRDQHDDPFTGDEEQRRAAHAIQQTDAASMTMRPETHAAAIESNRLAGDKAQQTAYGTAAGTGTGNTAAAMAPDAQYVANQNTRRDISKSLAPVAGGPMGEHVSVSDGLPQLDLQTSGGGNAGGGSDAVSYWAQQVAKDPSLMSTISTNKPLANAVRMHLAQSGGDLNKITNQSRQMGEAANDLLPMIDQIIPRAQQLHQQGLFTPVIGTLRRFLAEHGSGSLLGMGPDTANQIGRFNTDMGLLESGIARAHAGARGAGNSEMAARFEKLMNSTGDLPTFMGELQGVRDLLTIYAKHGGAGAGGADPYSNPDYQPR